MAQHDVPQAEGPLPGRSRTTGRFIFGFIASALLVVILIGAYALVWQPESDALVVYCAHDSVYADAVLRRFEEQTGIPLDVKYDTEATKSLGLVRQLEREADAPRCDVFWNNELLGTLELAEQGLLAPYKGSGYARIPEAFKDTQGRWAGLGARLRVVIVNTDAMAADEDAVAQRLKADDLSKVAIAKPLYGTTRTHYTVLWHHLGADGLKAWHADIHARGIKEVGGNAQVKQIVAAGTCDLGFTDTDDAFVAIDEGHPVDMVPVRIDGRTIAIPNTVMILKGAPHRDRAEKLIDYLLSAQTEIMLANAASRQVPLGEVDETQVPEAVERLRAWAADGYPLSDLGGAREACLNWLVEEYAK